MNTNIRRFLYATTIGIGVGIALTLAGSSEARADSGDPVSNSTDAITAIKAAGGPAGEAVGTAVDVLTSVVDSIIRHVPPIQPDPIAEPRPDATDTRPGRGPKLAASPSGPPAVERDHHIATAASDVAEPAVRIVGQSPALWTTGCGSGVLPDSPHVHLVGHLGDQWQQPTQFVRLLSGGDRGAPCRRCATSQPSG